MFARIFIFVFLSLFGGALLLGSYEERKRDETRHHSPSEAKVLGHEMRVDRKRWEDKHREAVRVDTRLNLAPNVSSELVVAGHFKDTASAWKFMLANPSGKTVNCLVSPTGDAATWDQFWSSPRVWSTITGSVLIVIGLWQLVRWPRFRVSEEVVAILFCSLFLTAGILAAAQMWPPLVTQVKAAGWDLVPCHSVERRIISSGKSSTTQFSFRYTYQGKDYLTVKTASTFDRRNGDTTPSVCMVNPEVPWRVELGWGWRPGLGLALFPMPFLAVGIFALIIPFSPGMRRMVNQARQDRTRSRFFIPADRMDGLGGRLFALVFAGSIVGVFASICAEMWMADLDHKWLLTIFLIPFVIAVLFLAKGFVAKVWESFRN